MFATKRFINENLDNRKDRDPGLSIKRIEQDYNRKDC
jgi:hypothetical protein